MYHFSYCVDIPAWWRQLRPYYYPKPFGLSSSPFQQPLCGGVTTPHHNLTFEVLGYRSFQGKSRSIHFESHPKLVTNLTIHSF